MKTLNAILIMHLLINLFFLIVMFLEKNYKNIRAIFDKELFYVTDFSDFITIIFFFPSFIIWCIIQFFLKDRIKYYELNYDFEKMEKEYEDLKIAYNTLINQMRQESIDDLSIDNIFQGLKKDNKSGKIIDLDDYR